jgi:hypothetical protein
MWPDRKQSKGRPKMGNTYTMECREPAGSEIYKIIKMDEAVLNTDKPLKLNVKHNGENIGILVISCNKVNFMPVKHKMDISIDVLNINPLTL